MITSVGRGDSVSIDKVRYSKDELTAIIEDWQSIMNLATGEEKVGDLTRWVAALVDEVDELRNLLMVNREERDSLKAVITNVSKALRGVDTTPSS